MFFDGKIINLKENLIFKIYPIPGPSVFEKDQKLMLLLDKVPSV